MSGFLGVREVVEYRKSGLSLNHVQGCPLDCAYCIRHTYGLWDQRQPRALMSDADAVNELVNRPLVPGLNDRHHLAITIGSSGWPDYYDRLQPGKGTQ